MVLEGVAIADLAAARSAIAPGMKRLLAVLLLLVLAHTARAAADDQNALARELTRLESEFGGHLGVAAKNLGTGEIIGYNASERFPTASVIKLPIMAAVFHLVGQKLIDPTVRFALKKEDKKPGSGILQYLSDSTAISLLDAVKLMVMLSDNTATNLVLDRIAPTHEARMAAVNDFLAAKGLKNTRLLNRLYSWQTKKGTPEGVRYGIGVSTPEDMVLMLEALHNKTLADSTSCEIMLDILKQQQYNEMIPRLLPVNEGEYLAVAHKTGEINETKVDVGLILSDKANVAIAVFVDKHPDHREGVNNQATLLAAYAARAVWNHFAGSRGYERRVPARDVDWNRFPGGNWLIYRSPAAPFPHNNRMAGFTARNGAHYPYFPHYADSSIVIVVPESFKETGEGTNMIVHFHGHLNDNMGVLEHHLMPQALASQKINALLVIPQGPYRARDSFGGKMEETGGLKRLVEDVLMALQHEKVLKTTRLHKLVLSAHSGGYRPVAFCLDRGGLNAHITDVFLFDALYENHEFFKTWVHASTGRLFGAYTEHLEDEHVKFHDEAKGEAKTRIQFSKTAVDHEKVVQIFLPDWLSKLDSVWQMELQ